MCTLYIIDTFFYLNYVSQNCFITFTGEINIVSKQLQIEIYLKIQE